VSVLLALQACVGTPTPTPPPSPPTTTPAQRNSAVAIEKQWLQSWFEGTPVRIEQRSESSFSVDVPREFCFEAGRSEVKPALAAVLDKVAQSLQRKPALRVQLLAAPGDAAAASPLAQQRATNVRKHLLARGVSSEQLAAATVAQAASVQLRIGLLAP
jgi:outer membrane protein OmpA-like peptidoglycan-associated protein